MTRPLTLHPDRLLPADPATRAIARELYDAVARLPIVSPHGHTDPEWWATDAHFGNAAQLLLHPDHYSTPWGSAIPMRTRASHGGSLPSAIICSGARPRGCGSTGCLPKPLG
jgi:hypothetical protein